MRKCKDMAYHIGVTLHLRPDQKQQEIIAVNDGTKRYVYNKLVRLSDERYQLKKVTVYSKPVADRLSYVEALLFTKEELKNAIPWLSDKRVDSCVLDNAIRNYNTAWKNHNEGRAGIPVMKRKSYEQSYQTNAHYKVGDENLDDGNVGLIDDHHIRLPKLGVVRFQCSKKIRSLLKTHRANTRVGSIKIGRDNCGDYYCVLQLHSDIPFYDDIPKTGRSVGIDLNLTNLYTDSDGNEVDNPRFAKNARRDITKAQRVLSRRCIRAKAEGRALRNSKNYQKQRVRTAKKQRRVARCREDYLNVQAKDLVKNHDLIVSEDLKVKNLMRNHCLAFAIADVSWNRFMILIEVKASLYGKEYVKVPPQYTTQTCSSCGHIMTKDEKIPLGVGEWACPECGTHHMRDVNAAVNILAKALS